MVIETRSHGTTPWVWLLVGSAVVTLAAGGPLLSWWRIRSAETELADHWQRTVEGIAHGVPLSHAAALQFDETDLSRTEFLRIQEYFSDYGDSLGGRRLWMVGQRDGHYAVGPSSRGGPSSEGPAATPGEASLPDGFADIPLDSVFATGVSVVRGPEIRNGNRTILGIAAIKSPRRGSVAWAIVLEAPSAAWDQAVDREARFSWISVVVLAALLLAGGAAIGSRSRRGARSGWTAHAGPILVGLLALSLTVIVATIMGDTQDRTNRRIFRLLADLTADRVVEAYGDLRDHAMLGTARFFEASDFVDQDEFRSYSRWVHNQEGVSAIGWAPIVFHSGRAAFEAQTADSLETGFRIWEVDAQGSPIEPQEEEWYAPIVYLVPAWKGMPLPGFNLRSHPVVKLALENAWRTGMVTSSGPVGALPGSAADQVLIVIPVHSKSGQRSQPSGFVLASISPSAFLQEAAFSSGRGHGTVEASLYIVGDQQRRLASTLRRPTSALMPVEELTDFELGLGLGVLRPVFFGDLTRLLVLEPNQQFFKANPLFQRKNGLLGGLAATVLLVLISLLLAARGRTLELLVQSRTTELSASEARYRMLAENTSDVIWAADMNLALQYLSPSIAKLLGGTVEIQLRRPMEERLTRESVDMLLERFQHEVESDSRPGVDPHRSIICEAQHIHLDGTLVPVEMNMTFLRDSSGAPSGVLGVTRSILERKQGEAAKKKLEEQLQQAMKMEAIGRLAGGIAHDFNNLLTAITGHASMAMMDSSPGERVWRSLEEISKGADRAAALTRQLLSFSRRQLIEPRHLSVNLVLKSLRGMVDRLIGEDVHLKLELASGVPSVHADPGQLEQVVMNLVVNARDAMPTGGTLVLETVSVLLDEDYCQAHAGARPGPHVMIGVSDTGMGMTEEVRRRIFEPFFTTKPSGKGTGLGLATAYGAVQQAGGFIEVYSEVDRGTTIKVYLPASATEPDFTATMTPACEDSPSGDATILLVEDEPLVREMVQRYLTRQGYRVLSAGHGPEALEISRGHSGTIHLLLTDVVMPGMNGRQLADILSTERRDMSVLYASGYTENAIAHQGIIDPGICFIAKPYSLRSLSQKIADILKPA
jgi:PAS domain S-box-containing protein